MTTRLTSRLLLNALLYTSAVATVGGSAVFLSTKSRNSTPDPALRTTSITPPKFPKIKSRDEQIADLRQSGKNAFLRLSESQSASSDDGIYDLLVVGAGATGAGIALDAATRGLKVALVERDDFSSGTSSKSTKLVHGGVRYLEKAVWNLDYNQYKLVKEALRERSYFLDTAPHLSSWIPVMVPLQKWYQAPYFWAGTKLYDFLAGSEGIESSYFLTRRRALEAFPMLREQNLIGALVYYDGQHNDSRMNVAIATTAALYGATTVNHLEVTALEKDTEGKICGARVQDLISERNGNTKPDEFIIRAKGVINATGPFVDAIQQMDEPQKRDIVAPSLGVHIVLPGYLSPERMGLIDPSSSDGRVIFFLPWEGSTIAGTTDTPCSVSQNPVPKEEDISWVLNEVREYLSPEIDILRSDVLAAWSGIRPLVRDPNAANTESLVRSHLITVSKSGLLTCVGGKWTTYRRMAEEAVDQAIESFNLEPRGMERHPAIGGLKNSRDEPKLDGACQTHKLRLIGAHGYSKLLFANLIEHFGIDVDISKHLAHSYGDRGWAVASLSTSSIRDPAPTASSSIPVPAPSASSQRLSAKHAFTTGEVLYAIQNEYAQTAIDVLARRTRLAFLDVQAALEALPVVIDIMGEQLGWSQTRREFEWVDAVRFFASMGLPESKFGITREEVLKAKLEITAPML